MTFCALSEAKGMDINEYIEKLYLAVISCVEEIREGNLTEGYKRIDLISQGLDWLIDVLCLTKDIHKVQVKSLKNTLSELIEAFENEDRILLADLLQYEVGEKLNQWYDELRTLLNSTENKYLEN